MDYLVYADYRYRAQEQYGYYCVINMNTGEVEKEEVYTKVVKKENSLVAQYSPVLNAAKYLEEKVNKKSRIEFYVTCRELCREMNGSKQIPAFAFSHIANQYKKILRCDFYDVEFKVMDKEKRSELATILSDEIDNRKAVLAAA